MINPRTFSFIKSAYGCLTVLNNHNILDRLQKQNTQPFIKEVVDLTLDHDNGVLQQKTTLWKHLSHQKFPSNDFYESYIQNRGTSIVKWEPNVLVDFRTNNELGVIAIYEKYFSDYLSWIYATCDARASSALHQRQGFLDFWAYVDRGIGLGGKFIYQDEKAGMDMLKHSTGGSIGLLTYDENGNNIQVTNQPISMEKLIAYNIRRINMIAETLKNDGILDNKFEKVFIQANDICQNMKGKSFEKFSKLHDELQMLLWKDIQCNPICKRSISFVFIKQIIEKPLTPREETFSKTFRANLPDRFYNLDDRGDFNHVFRAMILAGRELDPNLVEKFNHIHNNGVTLNTFFLQVMADLVKHGI